MTNEERKVIELALEALEDISSFQNHTSGDSYDVDKAITALREALAQPEQEPVATLDDLEQEIYENTRQFVSRDVMEWMLKRYYTTPPQRKSLTPDELADLWYKQSLDWLEFARAIEDAHNIKE